MRWMLLVIVMLWIILVGTLFTGCGLMPKRSPEEAIKNAKAPLSVALNPGLDKLILLGVLGLGVGVGLFFVVPAAHQFSLTIAGIAGGVEASALFLRVSLPAITWMIYILVGLGVIALIYELYMKYKRSKLGSV